MIFQYHHNMDREHHPPANIHPEASETGEASNVGIKDVGMSVPFGIAAQNVDGVQAKIRSGAGALELGFPGAVRGNRQAHTPGMWGYDQRMALREVAKANDIKFTTHASYGIPGLAGQDQQGNFSDEQRKMVTDEVKRAVEFARDTAGGGSVVVHTGEYTRAISEEPWAKNEKGKYKFKQFDDEPSRAIIRLVDKRTGQILQQIRKNQEVAMGKWLKAKNDRVVHVSKDIPELGLHEGDSYKLEAGRTYLDYEGDPVDRGNRLPEYDSETNSFAVETKRWDYFEREADEINEWLASKKGISKKQFEKLYPDEYKTVEEAFMYATTETQEKIADGWAGIHAREFDNDIVVLEKLKKAHKFYQDLEGKVPDEDKWRLLKNEMPHIYGAVAEFLSPEEKMPSEILDKAIREKRNNIWSVKEMVTGQRQQAHEQKILRENVTTPKKFGLDRSYDSYADAAIFAMDQSQNPQNPITLTLENIFPESYGAHPEELKDIIETSRQRMAGRLVKERNMSESEAKNKATNHIKATLDTGHLNMWRKFWQDDPKKNRVQNQNDFDKWLLTNVETLAKNKLIGNVHLTDNYGYQDDHLAPGQGNTPVKDIVKILKKHGYDNAWTVEPGADASTDQGDVYGLMKTWRYFGSPVYGLDGASAAGGPARGFQEIQHSYFGYAAAPYFIFPPYAPSNDWSLWSEVQME